MEYRAFSGLSLSRLGMGAMRLPTVAGQGEKIDEGAAWELIEAAYEADGFVFGTPVHYAAASGNMTAFMDRLFYSELRGNANKAFRMKPAAAVVSARRAGTDGRIGLYPQTNKVYDCRLIRTGLAVQ